MRPAHSYQSPSMTPPDQPDLDPDGQACSTSRCKRDAIDQHMYDEPMCEEHLRDAVAWDNADNQNKADREEYGQFETDRSVG